MIRPVEELHSANQRMVNGGTTSAGRKSRRRPPLILTENVNAEGYFPSSLHGPHRQPCTHFVDWKDQRSRCVKVESDGVVTAVHAKAYEVYCKHEGCGCRWVALPSSTKLARRQRTTKDSLNANVSDNESIAGEVDVTSNAEVSFPTSEYLNESQEFVPYHPAENVGNFDSETGECRKRKAADESFLEQNPNSFPPEVAASLVGQTKMQSALRVHVIHTIQKLVHKDQFPEDRTVPLVDLLNILYSPPTTGEIQMYQVLSWIHSVTGAHSRARRATLVREFKNWVDHLAVHQNPKGAWTVSLTQQAVDEYPCVDLHVGTVHRPYAEYI